MGRQDRRHRISVFEDDAERQPGPAVPRRSRAVTTRLCQFSQERFKEWNRFGKLHSSLSIRPAVIVGSKAQAATVMNVDETPA
jgi:hypothetical protein